MLQLMLDTQNVDACAYIAAARSTFATHDNLLGGLGSLSKFCDILHSGGCWRGGASKWRLRRHRPFRPATPLPWCGVTTCSTPAAPRSVPLALRRIRVSSSLRHIHAPSCSKNLEFFTIGPSPQENTVEEAYAAWLAMTGTIVTAPAFPRKFRVCSMR